MHGVAARVHLAVDQHHVAHLQRAHLLFGERRGQHDFAAGQREARAAAPSAPPAAPDRDTATW